MNFLSVTYSELRKLRYTEMQIIRCVFLVAMVSIGMLGDFHATEKNSFNSFISLLWIIIKKILFAIKYFALDVKSNKKERREIEETTDNQIPRRKERN